MFRLSFWREAGVCSKERRKGLQLFEHFGESQHGGQTTEAVLQAGLRRKGHFVKVAGRLKEFQTAGLRCANRTYGGLYPRRAGATERAFCKSQHAQTTEAV